MARADHVYVHRLGYTHHGIDAGDGTVIHYTGEVGQKSNAAICRTTCDEFAKGCEIHVRHYGQCSSPEVTMKRATRRLGEGKYHIVFNNCEHFATWCKTGRRQSDQVETKAASSAGAALAGATAAGGVGVVGVAGAVAGFSGSGIMSGMAAVGGVVGGGAVVGIGLAGAAPAAFAAGAMMYVLKDDPILHGAEREARRAGRYATVAGGVSGSAAVIGTLSAVGTAGLSGAGITSGLATIGSVVGGGMFAGIVMTTAAPAVAAAVVGVGTYRLWRRFGRKAKP